MRTIMCPHPWVLVASSPSSQAVVLGLVPPHAAPLCHSSLAWPARVPSSRFVPCVSPALDPAAERNMRGNMEKRRWRGSKQGVAGRRAGGGGTASWRWGADSFVLWRLHDPAANGDELLVHRRGGAAAARRREEAGRGKARGEIGCSSERRRCVQDQHMRHAFHEFFCTLISAMSVVQLYEGL
ncbi:hypothetical protein PR202_gb12570 [Eleusine coracana subsp. coracana]|uniref:Uncharacterized protein n=1 Tax=Eleusine coracana subsp. coracana TaxID=191504 RepID=A0AAV5ENC4_ELECO|nr:hypothetical protein PR202_gb12570 [Eleusine coracana subsp. coracana]